MRPRRLLPLLASPRYAVLTLWLTLGVFTAPVAARSERVTPPRAYVTASVARVRALPARDAEVVTTLRVGAAVQQGGREKGFVQVTTRSGQTGYVKARYLSTTAPDFDALLARATNPRRSTAERKRAAERAVGLRPSDEPAIRALIAVLKSRTNTARGKKFHHMAVKGIIAAERRNVSWDGPLYPIRDGVAYLPFACSDAFVAGRENHDKVTLRARTFPLAASGKVVSITEGGYRTEKLTTPSCHDGQATYTLPPGAADGALVPSWLVAGFSVEAVRAEGKGQFVSSVVTLRHQAGTWTLARRSPDATMVPYGRLPMNEPGAHPVAVMSENEADIAVLFVSDGAHRACTGPERKVWWARFVAPSSSDAAAVIKGTSGHRYHQRFAAGCPQHVFAGLDGEPRCARLPEGCELGALDVTYPAPFTVDAAPAH